MTAEIVSLDDYRANPHLEGHAKCLACGHEWAAVAPVGTHRLDCPQCHTLRGTWSRPIGPGEGQAVYCCRTCGGDSFYLTTEMMACRCCGSTMHSWYLGQDPSPPWMPPKAG